MNHYREITDERYEDLREVLPIIYISRIDDNPVENGFAVCEAYDYNEQGVVLTVCFHSSGKYYATEANIKSASGYITDYRGAAYTRNNVAETQHVTRFAS